MGTAECHGATQQLLAFIKQPQVASAALDAALEHIRDCPHCRRNIGYLVRGLRTDTVDRLTCGVCEERLPEYAAAVAAGATGSKWRAVAMHLALCPHCAATYAELIDLVALAEGRRGVAPPDDPAPDLSFLDPPKRWRLEDAGRLVIEFTAELLNSLRMPPQPGFAMAGLKAGETPTALRPFALLDEVPDEQVTITIEPGHHDPAQSRLIVKVYIPSRGEWPNQSGTFVTIKRGDTELGSQATDAFGEVVFDEIGANDLEQLVFVIERAGGG